VARNTVALSLTQFARTGFNMILSVLVARQLGAEGLGKYAVLTAYLHIFEVLSMVGVPRLVIREMARQPDQNPNWFQRTVVNQALGALGSAVMLILVAHWLNHPVDTTRGLEIIAIALLPYALSSAAESVFQAREKMGFIAIAQIVGRGIQTVGSTFVLLTGHGIVALAWTAVVGQCLVTIIEMGVVIKMGLWSGFRLELRQSVFLFRRSFDFFLMSLSVVIFNRLDVLILSQMVGEEAVGFYNAAYLVVRVVNFFSASYGEAVYPALSRLFDKAQSRFKMLMNKSLLFGVTCSLLIAILLMIAAEPIIGILYEGEEYALSVFLLRVEIPFVVIFMWNVLLSNGLMAGNLQRSSVIVSAAKLAAGLVYYLLLTAWWQATGTALATVLAGLTGTILNYYFLNKQLYALDIVSLAVKPLIIGGIVVAALWIAWGIPWPALAIAAGLLYILLLIVFRIFSREDLYLLREIVSLW
jgi:O-antigen/teichoic acid export membrane protein